MNKATDDQTYDLVIVGSGLVGASLAVALSGRGLRIAVVDASIPSASADRDPSVTGSYDDRAIALSYGSIRVFEGMGLWPEMSAAAEPISHIHISDRGRFGFAHLDAAMEQVPALGAVITARQIGQVLLAALDRCQDIDLIAPAQVIDLQVDADAATVSLEQNTLVSTLRTRLLVAADGGKSFIREQLNIKTRHWDYGQHAVVANITPSKPHGGTAFERFTQTGPVALLPMTDGRCALVWTVEDSDLDAIMALDDAGFLNAFQERFGYRLGRFTRVGRRQQYPLSMIRALESVRPRVALIGNAAHTLHPIAGQGFNLGVRDIAALAEVIVDAGDEDIGHPMILDRYDHWRRRDQQAISLATDSLVRLFSNPLPAVGLARNLGLLALDALPFARRRLARAAMGQLGNLPRLARGLPLD